MVLKTNDGTLSELITQLQEEASTLALHLFNALWQGDQFNLISQDPPNGWVIMVLDFAENYSCRFQDEIQSVHWGHNSATIHPIVAYYKCPKCGEPTTNSMIMITHDNTHDHHAVHAFSQIAVDHLKEQIPDMTQIVRFSDGCPTQYKSRGPFMDVSYGKSDYGVNYQHEFFGSRHGKGPSDGESGVIKRQATDAVMSGNVVIANAKDLFVYVRDNCCTSSSNDECQHFQRSAFWIEHIDRDRGRQTSQTVKDTRSFHSVKSVRPNIIGTRKLSCFCQTCVSEKGTCHNQAFVEQYIYKDVQRGTSAVAPPEPESEPTMYAGVEPMEIEADNNDEEPRALNTSGVAVETMSRAVETTSKSAETTSGAVKASGATEITSSPNQAMVTPVKESLSNDMYVAVRFQSRPKNIIYLAMILNVDDKEVTLAFLKRDNSGYYDFTDEKHHIHPREDICGILNSPEMVQVRRSLVCRFKQSELDELAKKEIAILK